MGPWQWKQGVLTTGLPGNSLKILVCKWSTKLCNSIGPQLAKATTCSCSFLLWNHIALPLSLPNRCECVICRSDVGTVSDTEKSIHLRIECLPAGFFSQWDQDRMTPLLFQCPRLLGVIRGERRQGESVASSQNSERNWKSKSLKNSNSPLITPRYKISSSLKCMGQGQCLSKSSKGFCVCLWLR